MTKRTDIHRPSAIDPADYDYVGIEYDRVDDLYDCMALAEQRKQIQAHMKRTGGTYARHEHGGNCQVCGAYALYTCLFWHRGTNVYIRTGFDCAMKMDMGDPALFRSIKRAVKDAREAKAGRRKAAAVLTDLNLAEAWNIAEEMSDDELRTMHAISDRGCMTGDLMTLRDIVGKLVRYGSISDGQIKFARALVERIHGRKDIEAKRAAEKAAAEPIPTDGKRHKVTGTIVAIKVREGNWGIEVRIIVKDDRGFVVMGGCPGALEDEREVERGDRVEFVARLKASDDDPKFGFYNRPTKAKNLTTAAQEG